MGQTQPRDPTFRNLKRVAEGELEKDENVRFALGEVCPQKKRVPGPDKRQAKKAIPWIVALLIAATFHFLLRLRLIPISPNHLPPIQRVVVGAIAVCLVFLADRVARAVWLERLEDPVARYNLRRVLKLVVGLIIAVIAISILFANWYTAAVSLGLISLVLGFALQTPISSFIGWVYIMVRKPYRVGDRIHIGDANGDVIDVGYLDTTLWEFGGPYLSTDQPSGRVVKFPNSNVFNQAVFNYSWPLFPYIWNEVSFQLAYESDLKFVAGEIQKVAEEVVGNQIEGRAREFRQLLIQTPVDEIHIKEKPSVFFRVSTNTWVEAVVRFLVDPKEAATIKNQLTIQVLERLNGVPDKALFPKSNAR